MMPPKEILVVDDEVGIRELLSEILEDEGYRVRLAENASQARDYRRTAIPGMVLLDIWMPDTDGVTLLREWAASGQLTMPVVMMSGHGTIETAVEATRIGAFDFLEKPIGLQKLLATVAKALKVAPAPGLATVSLAALGTSAAIQEVERALQQMLRARRPILLAGEPGSGHALAAAAIRMPDAPWIEIDSPAKLVSQPLALLEDARDGVLYCPEISGYSRSEQKGLAFLLPKGDRYNVTVVCSSSEPLGNLAAEGRFDVALLSSLSAGVVTLPPIRQRPEDIPLLIERAWRDETARLTGPVPTLSAEALAVLSRAYWPGNLTQLSSIIANLVLTGVGEIGAAQAQRLLGETRPANASPVTPEVAAKFFELPLREAREAFERIYFEQLLGRELSNMSRVAEKAGLERTHLYRKLKQLNVRFSRRGEEPPAA
jgi:DNA-binding NtrC family response regulator